MSVLLLQLILRRMLFLENVAALLSKQDGCRGLWSFLVKDACVSSSSETFFSLHIIHTQDNVYIYIHGSAMHMYIRERFR